jgi:hypothetical protein
MGCEKPAPFDLRTERAVDRAQAAQPCIGKLARRRRREVTLADRRKGDVERRRDMGKTVRAALRRRSRRPESGERRQDQRDRACRPGP